MNLSKFELGSTVVKTHLLNTLGICFFSVSLLFPSASRASDEEPYNEDPKVVDEWLENWGKANVKAATGNYVLHHFTDRMYVVKSSLEWTPNDPSSNIKPIIVPAGFVTDFASVPRLFWSVYPPEGKYGFPSIFHDYLYWTQTVSRKEADRIFKIMMDEFEVGKVSTATIHSAVRAAGMFAWRTNKKDCMKGERRLLVKFPENQPNTKWEDWKLKTDVYGGRICSSHKDAN